MYRTYGNSSCFRSFCSICRCICASVYLRLYNVYNFFNGIYVCICYSVSISAKNSYNIIRSNICTCVYCSVYVRCLNIVYYGIFYYGIFYYTCRCIRYFTLKVFYNILLLLRRCILFLRYTCRCIRYFTLKVFYNIFYYGIFYYTCRCIRCFTFKVFYNIFYYGIFYYTCRCIRYFTFKVMSITSSTTVSSTIPGAGISPVASKSAKASMSPRVAFVSILFNVSNAVRRSIVPVATPLFNAVFIVVTSTSFTLSRVRPERSATLANSVLPLNSISNISRPMFVVSPARYLSRCL